METEVVEQVELTIETVLSATLSLISSGSLSSEELEQLATAVAVAQNVTFASAKPMELTAH